MNDGASGASASERDSLYKEENEDSDFDETTYNNNFNGVVRENIPQPLTMSGGNSSSAMAKFNGSDENFDSLSEQSRHSE